MTAVLDDGLPEASDNELRDAFRKMNAKFGKSQKVQSVVDGRSLRATGRTEQLNVNIHPELKLAIAEHVKAEGGKIVDWVERVFEEALGLRGN